MTKVLVLAGGDSAEREVSLRSSAAVVTALQMNGYEVVVLDPTAPNPDYEQQLAAADVVFPVLHGKGGEDGSIQDWLTAHGRRYIGADMASSAHCFDKWRYKQTLIKAGLPVPRGELVSATDIWLSELTMMPFVLKPYDGGSSVDTFIVRDTANYDRLPLTAALTRYPQMLLEELIVGTETTVGVLLDEALPVIEIIPPLNAEFDYDNKYNGHTQEICPPQHLSSDIQKQAQDIALQIHHLLGVRDMSRTDIMVSSDGLLYVLETNTIPGMTSQSLLPRAAAVAGYAMSAVVKLLVEAALARAV